ncbi:MAG: fimbrillin family protein [Rikenellaceae bacterium]
MKNIMYLLSIVAITVSCTQNENFDEKPKDENLVTFTASEITTRLIDNGTTFSWELGDQIQIVAESEFSNLWSVHEISNTTTGEMSFVSGAEYYTDSIEIWNYYAWYPSTLSISGTTLSLDLNNQDITEQFVFASENSSTNEVTLNFAPQYTKLIFNLKAGLGDISDLTGAKATINGVNTSGEYDYLTAEFSNLTSATLTPTVEVDESDTTTATITLYILETKSSDCELDISIRDDNYVISLTNEEWLKGFMYEYNVTVGAE